MVSPNLTLLLGAVVVTSTIFLPVLRAKGAPTTNSTTTISLLKETVPALMKKGIVQGPAIALIRGGNTIWVYGFGVKNAESPQPVTAVTVFEQFH